MPQNAPDARPETTPRPLGPGKNAAILLFALFFPTVLTYAYFVMGERLAPGLARAVFVVGKTAQFLFPAAIVGLALKRRVWMRGVNRRGLAVGAAFGLVVAAVIYFGARTLAASPDAAPIFERLAAELRARLESFGLATPGLFALVLLFYSVFHSGLEEYYWRWFVCGRLREKLAPFPAALAANAAFTLHHILLLGVYFGYDNALTWVSALGVFVGGLTWQAIYAKTDSIYGPWLSHGLIDAGIFAAAGATLFG
ncbi:MAG: CPBP family intramembrane metalloprotease [Thermoguttaceae bacterium]|nr:CPBP family intramembrane metalloprotease [Thermoguttaceae bacterium]